MINISKEGIFCPSIHSENKGNGEKTNLVSIPKKSIMRALLLEWINLRKQRRGREIKNKRMTSQSKKKDGGQWPCKRDVASE